MLENFVIDAIHARFVEIDDFFRAIEFKRECFEIFAQFGIGNVDFERGFHRFESADVVTQVVFKNRRYAAIEFDFFVGIFDIGEFDAQNVDELRFIAVIDEDRFE